jgi:hypothetical protein
MCWLAPVLGEQTGCRITRRPDDGRRRDALTAGRDRGAARDRAELRGDQLAAGAHPLRRAARRSALARRRDRPGRADPAHRPAPPGSRALLKRAIAASMVRGPEAALADLAALEGDQRLAGYRYLPARKADMLRRLGRDDEAALA